MTQHDDAWLLSKHLGGRGRKISVSLRLAWSTEFLDIQDYLSVLKQNKTKTPNLSESG